MQVNSIKQHNSKLKCLAKKTQNNYTVNIGSGDTEATKNVQGPSVHHTAVTLLMLGQ